MYNRLSERKEESSGNVLRLAAVVMNVLLALLWHCGAVRAGAFGYSEVFALKDMCEGVEFVPAVMAVLYCLSAVLLVLPVLRKGARPTKLALPLTVSSMSALFWVYIVYYMQTEMAGIGGVEYGYTVAFWLFGVVSVVLTAVGFILSRSAKRSRASQPA